MTESTPKTEILELAAQIVSAYLGNNAVPPESLPGLIQQIYASLLGTNRPVIEAEKPQPAVPVKKSVHPDYLICLEDGKKMKILRRYLKTAFGLTPEQYREKWGLPSDYPMVAPNYAKHRSSLARQIGLGTKSRGGVAVEAVA